MKAVIRVTANFKKEAKPLLKKYKSLGNDLAALEQQLLANPQLGTPLGSNAFKIRLKISSKGKGKSGGARVITHLETDLIANVELIDEEITVNLISIYDKSETEAISDKELKRLIASI
ncbi:MAG: hypothetical protein V4619_16400 [Bacteroidota bacterium]